MDVGHWARGPEEDLSQTLPFLPFFQAPIMQAASSSRPFHCDFPAFEPGNCGLKLLKLVSTNEPPLFKDVGVRNFAPAMRK